MPKQVRITVPKNPDQPLKFETEGFVGTECVKSTQEIEIAIGNQSGDKEFTEDYYKKPDGADVILND